ncbi:hypothetical protein [Burkholderia glumae]|uniref:hypothetical protein n=1 Tax=Burkholderia glumae TaxID=337 RepID=UPI003B9BEA78
MNDWSLFNGPALVLIDVPTRTYVRYFGNKMTMRARTDEGYLTSAEIELFRVDPRRFMGIETS